MGQFEHWRKRNEGRYVVYPASETIHLSGKTEVLNIKDVGMKEGVFNESNKHLLNKNLTLDEEIAKCEIMCQANLFKANRPECEGTYYQRQRLLWAAMRLARAVELRTERIHKKYCS